MLVKYLTDSESTVQFWAIELGTPMKTSSVRKNPSEEKGGVWSAIADLIGQMTALSANGRLLVFLSLTAAFGLIGLHYVNAPPYICCIFSGLVGMPMVSACRRYWT